MSGCCSVGVVLLILGRSLTGDSAKSMGESTADGSAWLLAESPIRQATAVELSNVHIESLESIDFGE